MSVLEVEHSQTYCAVQLIKQGIVNRATTHRAAPVLTSDSFIFNVSPEAQIELQVKSNYVHKSVEPSHPILLTVHSLHN